MENIPETPRAYDCQACGACCATHGESDAYVRLTALDLDRLRGTGLPVIEVAEGDGDDLEVLPRLGTKLDTQGRRVCVGLAGELGRTCACAVYELRPMACRMFEAGSLLCRLARQERGLPV